MTIDILSLRRKPETPAKIGANDKSEIPTFVGMAGM